MPRKTKRKPVTPPVPTTEVRFLYGGGFRVTVCEKFQTREEAMAFAKTLGQPVKETADTWD